MTEARKTLKHRKKIVRLTILVAGRSKRHGTCVLVRVSAASQHGGEADRKMGMCTEESQDKQGSKSPGRGQICSFFF